MIDTHSFAHLSDIHIGAFRHPKLQQLVLEAFRKAIDICIERKVDFIIISGDLFDSNIPDMTIVNEAVKKMREVKEHGTEFYVVYGSHDFSPTQSSIVDILESAGIFHKVTKGKVVDGSLKLEFQEDPKTGAKLVGISGRKAGIEKEYFSMLDRESLERERGFKIFVFHGALSEYKPEVLAQMDSISISNFPKGFNYYAGGHIHEKTIGRMADYEHVIYPGTLFGGDYKDFEKSAKGQKRGFFIVSFSDKVQHVEFIETPLCDYEIIEYDADGKSATKVQTDLKEDVKKINSQGKLVIIKVKGELSSGKTSDIEFAMMRKMLEDNGALYVLLNHHALTSKEYFAIKVGGEDIETIKLKLFKESIGSVKVSNPKLKGEEGVKLSSRLFEALKQDKKENETKSNYESRIVRDGLEVFELKEAIQ